jgi:hypothetical protein
MNKIIIHTHTHTHTRNVYYRASTDSIPCSGCTELVPIYYSWIKAQVFENLTHYSVGTQLHVIQNTQWIRGVTLTSHPHLVPRSWKSRTIPLLPLWARWACYRVKTQWIPCVSYYVIYSLFLRQRPRMNKSITACFVCRKGLLYFCPSRIEGRVDVGMKRKRYDVFIFKDCIYKKH